MTVKGFDRKHEMLFSIIKYKTFSEYNRFFFQDTLIEKRRNQQDGDRQTYIQTYRQTDRDLLMCINGGTLRIMHSV